MICFAHIFQNEPQEKVTNPPKAAATPATPPLKVVPDSSFTRPCDLKTDLFVLQPERLNSSTPLKGKLTNCHASGCERPFSVQKIPHSNLILLVVDTLCPCGSKQLDIGPQEVTAEPGLLHYLKFNVRMWPNVWTPNKPNRSLKFLSIFEGSCGHRRMLKDRLPRRRPSKCINYHPEEIEIQQCGAASTVSKTTFIFWQIIILLQIWALTA